MPRNFFVVKEKIRKMAHYSFQKIVGGKNYNYLQKEKLCLGMILNLFRKLRETLDLKIEATEGIFSCLCDFLFLLKFMLKGEIFGLHDTKQFVNSGMGKKISFREFFPL